MSYWNSFVYREAAPGRHIFDLSGQVIGTHDFGVPYRPIFCREVVPGDIWNIKLSTLVRLAGMVLPTFGRVKIINRFFYVPMTLIHGHWNEVLSGNLINVGSVQTASVITVSNKALAYAFRYSPSDQETDTDWIYKNVSGPADIRYYYNQEDTYSDISFTRRGRQIISLLKALGYSINWDETDNTEMSAMPLLAYAKVCYDWLVDSNFVNSVDLDVQPLFKLNNGSLTFGQVTTILRVFSTCYEKDYFTSAWQTPNQVDSSNAGNPAAGVSFPGWLGGNNSTSGSIQHTSLSDTFTLNSARTLSDYGLRTLESLSSFVRSRLFTGFRIDKQIEADFGLKLNPEIANRSYYIGSVEVPINISDVMATSSFSSTDDAAYDVRVGEYAGKGIGFNDGFLRFEADNPEYGYILCLSAVVPETGYVQGRHRELFHLNKFDFYNAKFEQLGVQAIRYDELYACNTNIGRNHSANPNSIFGYAPRYSEYKCGAQTTNMIGDYLFGRDSNNAKDMDAFHLFRLFSKNEDIQNTYSFKSTADSDQFMRIFNNTSGAFEHFNLIWNFDINVERMMLPINDISDIEGHGDVKQMKHMDDLLHG